LSIPTEIEQAGAGKSRGKQSDPTFIAEKWQRAEQKESDKKASVFWGSCTKRHGPQGQRADRPASVLQKNGKRGKNRRERKWEKPTRGPEAFAGKSCSERTRQTEKGGKGWCVKTACLGKGTRGEGSEEATHWGKKPT